MNFPSSTIFCFIVASSAILSVAEKEAHGGVRGLNRQRNVRAFINPQAVTTYVQHRARRRLGLASESDPVAVVDADEIHAGYEAWIEEGATFSVTVRDPFNEGSEYTYDVSDEGNIDKTTEDDGTIVYDGIHPMGQESPTFTLKCPTGSHEVQDWEDASVAGNECFVYMEGDFNFLDVISRRVLQFLSFEVDDPESRKLQPIHHACVSSTNDAHPDTCYDCDGCTSNKIEDIYTCVGRYMAEGGVDATCCKSDGSYLANIIFSQNSSTTTAPSPTPTSNLPSGSACLNTEFPTNECCSGYWSWRDDVALPGAYCGSPGNLVCDCSSSSMLSVSVVALTQLATAAAMATTLLWM